MCKSLLVAYFIGSWKPIFYWLLGPKKSIFPEWVRQNAADPYQIRYTWTGQGWQRSGNFGRDRPILAKMGAGTSPAEPEFFCLVNHATFWQLHNGRFQPNLVTKRTVSRRWNRKDIFENFHFRDHLSQNQTSKLGHTGTSITAGYKSWDALQRHTVYSTLWSKSQGASEVASIFLYDVRWRSYGASNLPNFWIFFIFSPTQNP